MPVTALTSLACPLDGTPLLPHGAALQCADGHSFDRAREGYWNLLSVQHKASADPGDSRDMVLARRRFLGEGHYAPIAQHVFDVACDLARSKRSAEPFAIADAGCGEGDMLERFAAFATAEADDIQWRLGGFDVSKWAVQAAAKRHSLARAQGAAAITWLVANNRHPPFAAESLDLILCLFGFPVWEGFAPVLAHDGCVLLIDPGPDHLIELREIIYPRVEKSEPPSVERALAAGFSVARQDRVRFRAEIPQREALADLVAMTPHAHRMTAPGRAALEQIDALAVTVDVVARLMRRI